MATQSPTEPPPPVPPAPSSASASSAPTDTALRGPLRRLLLTSPPANVSMYLLWGALPGILLPLQVAELDSANKTGNLAVITTLGALAAMLTQPLAGALSDRTRSRYGRRGPWIVGGALIGGLALLGMAAANTLVQIGIAWVMVQIAYNFVQGPLTAIMPDRVPRAVRGTFSAVIGFSAMLGTMGGQIVATRFADRIDTGYVVFAGLALVMLALFVAFNPDRDNRGEPRRPVSIRELARSFWFDPRKHPDFGWAFLGRLLLNLGYFLITQYQLYLLQEYIGLGDDAIGFVPVLGMATLCATLVATAVGGPLSDRLGRRKVFVFAASVVLAVAMAVPWALPTKTGMVLYAAAAGLGYGLFATVDSALISEVLPAQEDFGKDLGVVNIAATLPQVLAPGLAGAVAVALGYSALFPVGIVLVLCGGLAVAPIKAVR
ncbi:MFS transporter [Streptomyces sp. NPDC051956]|uniref:MFS transporter n=1 Tax=Streptomyces sp. NPDC051956 TaxID=3365677 RepID=UPI0037CF947F